MLARCEKCGDHVQLEPGQQILSCDPIITPYRKADQRTQIVGHAHGVGRPWADAVHQIRLAHMAVLTKLDMLSETGTVEERMAAASTFINKVGDILGRGVP